MEVSINDALPIEIITMILNLVLYPPIIYEVCRPWHKVMIEGGYKPPGNQNICDIAAKRGHYSVLKWARDRKYMWGESTDLLAARSGNMKLWIWARSNGCPKSDSTYFTLAYLGYLTVGKSLIKADQILKFDMIWSSY